MASEMFRPAPQESRFSEVNLDSKSAHEILTFGDFVVKGL
jgi:hypothetical protein